jgi:hypothetical protein
MAVNPLEPSADLYEGVDLLRTMLLTIIFNVPNKAAA